MNKHNAFKKEIKTNTDLFKESEARHSFWHYIMPNCYHIIETKYFIYLKDKKYVFFYNANTMVIKNANTIMIKNTIIPLKDILNELPSKVQDLFIANLDLLKDS